MLERNPKTELHSLLDEGRNLNQELKNSSDENPDRQRGRRISEVAPDNTDGKENCGNIQNYRSSRRQSKNMETIEDAHGQRGQGNKKQVRKDNPVQIYGHVSGHVRARKQLHHRR